MAIQAALTGHLVISTLHTIDALSAVVRLMDSGVAPYLISATLLRWPSAWCGPLCPHCKRDTAIDPDVWDTLISPFKGKMPERIKQPAGCLNAARPAIWAGSASTRSWCCHRNSRT
ncbi:MAG: ATPase, T2SS/T4P/T4SS family [Gammaproteobacteria bacterium]